jgi:hypothetical protein
VNWTTPADIKRQVQRLWDSGVLLAAMIRDDSSFPRRLTLKSPNSTDLAARFDEVRTWIAALRDGEPRGYRIVWRELNHRVIGQNNVPAEVWIDSLDAALGLIGKRTDADRFSRVVEETRTRCPELVPWLARRPLRALELRDDWPRLLDVVLWMRANPNSGLYLRQIDIPGVHSKFIERHRGVLSELLDIAFPPDASLCEGPSGMKHFSRRYGFRDKPIRIRFRILDANVAIFPGGCDQDIAIPQDTFAGLDLTLRHVFVTENEINFLAFPPVPESMVIFGAGYGFEMLARSTWLHTRNLHYWGDIDTHGFAILDQLRGAFPNVQSLLMDRDTFLAHREHWGTEPQPEHRNLPRLTPEEADLYDDLRYNRTGERLRLEQERIGFGWLQAKLKILLP